MSGASCASTSVSGWIPLARMCSAPLSSSVESVPSIGTKVSIAIEPTVKLMARLLHIPVPTRHHRAYIALGSCARVRMAGPPAGDRRRWDRDVSAETSGLDDRWTSPVPDAAMTRDLNSKLGAIAQ